MNDTEFIQRIGTVFTGVNAVIALALFRELTAELKELRGFVGAMNRVAIEEWHGHWVNGATEFAFFDIEKEIIALGTDPADAWRKMNAGEGE